VHLRHQRTGGIEYGQSTARRFVLHGRRNAVRREDHGRVVGHLVELVDEYRPQAPQAIDHVHVVDDFVPHVDRRAEQRDGAFDDVDGTVDAGTETTRVGEQDLHAVAVIFPGWS
jgi:hypothetical protein